jgi:3-deoxy-manno-octulosonate cytidylyltransferase (CMP-KDO synthetase)
MMNILGIIPARFGSSRFPGKPLIDLAGKSMIQRVYEQAKKSKYLSNVIVATDDQRIFDHVLNFGGNAVMTSDKHQSGTDRCAEVIEKSKENYNAVINIQGDEPFIDPGQIDILCACFDDPTTELATLIMRTEDPDHIMNINRIKVTIDKNNNALYFSRSPIPFVKGAQTGEWGACTPYYLHIGIYGYRTDILKEITKLPVSNLEKAESLEQLRWLENGYRIKVSQTKFESHSIDSPEDVERVLKMAGLA